MKEFKHITAIAVFFVSVLLISNIASTKIIGLWVFDFDAGTLLFPLSYIFGDIMTEVYGFKRARRVIWMGFAMNILMALVLIGVGHLPASGMWEHQEAYNTILGLAPRIVFASMVAYTFGEFLNSYVLAKMKVWMNGRALWMRTIGSTLVGEGFDTVIFVVLAFWTPEASWGFLFAIIASNYVFKVGVEVLFTPVTYKIVGFLKRSEGCDVYDRKTNFNPFKLKS
jgi:queuosine precursor transporter